MTSYIRRLTAAGCGLVLLAAGLPATADPASADSVAEIMQEARRLEPPKIKTELPSGPTTAFVEFTIPSTVEAARTGKASPAAIPAQVADKGTEIATALGGDANVLYTLENAITGVAVQADGNKIAELASRADVAAIRPLTVHTIDNASADALTRAHQSWQSAGVTGKDTTVVVIDSGIDFTHATFGGTGDYGPYDDAAARTEAPTWPQGKVIGGWDFVGDDYWGAAKDSVAKEDPNLIDVPERACEKPPMWISRTGGHGTHVAGTAAGYGVGADGKTYTGGYAAIDQQQLESMIIGPGSAPEANLIAFKVFGCAGNTVFVQKALDELLAKEGGQYKWKDVDVVNMSLSSAYAPAADPENIVVDTLFKERGIVVVNSSGNSGDMYDIGGSPSNAKAALTVANSRHGVLRLDRLTASVGDDKTPYNGRFSLDYPANDVVGPLEVVRLTGANAQACDELSEADSDKVWGKAVFIDWPAGDDNKCYSKQRFDNIEDAGGKAVIVPSNDGKIRVVDGNDLIPGFGLDQEGTQRLTRELAAGPVHVTFDYAGRSNGAIIADESAVDTLAPSSSRGVHGSFGVVKPDVTAPGTNIVSAAVGSGNQAIAYSGTSMSTPHVSGIAALLRQAKPQWNATQLKAGIMNTAHHDVRNSKGTVYGPQRVGSGRVDALSAVTNDVVMYDSQATDLVTANFGIVEFTQQPKPVTRTVTVENLGSQAATVDLSYRPLTTVPGVNVSVSPAQLAVPAGAKKEVELTLTIDAAAYRKVPDPTMAVTQKFYSADYVREFISTATGLLVGKVADQELRLPVSAAPKPVSQLHSALAGNTIKTTGMGFHYAAGTDVQKELQPLAMPFEFIAESDKRPLPTLPDQQAEAAIRATDLRRIGVRTDNANIVDGVGDTKVVVGVETWGPWTLMPLGNSTIELDVLAKGRHFTVKPTRQPNSDVVYVDIRNQEFEGVALEFRNDYRDAALDTNTMDTQVVAIPFTLGAVGFTADEIKSGKTPMTITVKGRSDYAPHTGEAGWELGDTDRITFEYDPAKAITFTTNIKGTGLHADGADIPFALPASAAADAMASETSTSEQPPSLMMIHFHNTVGQQVEVLGPEPEPSPSPSESSTAEPTEEPTEVPTEAPTESPTAVPTEAPSTPPTEQPTVAPTQDPTASPTEVPSGGPTGDPSGSPSAQPTTPSQPSLPITGSDLAAPGLLTLGIVLAGGVLVMRRRHLNEQH